jgi:DNA invertase Pin-like site-specific DNA recombinase
MGAAALSGPVRAEAVAALANMTTCVLGGTGERRAEDHEQPPERTALVYLRQSSMAQVREHTESTRTQSALADKAAALGWPRSDIEVIDTDLGISGNWGVAREGFTALVTRVCSGDVGAIFGIEITRLARSNADVARLAEFARITGTLLIDPDGVYDPADVNHRVLLGFKGTMGEALCRYRHSIS